MDWSYIKQGWRLTKICEMNEVKYSRYGSENSFVCWAVVLSWVIRLQGERETGSESEDD